MLRYLARRIAYVALMLAGLVLITFVISNVTPADPAALAAGPDATPEMVATMRREYGLDRPLPEQFLRYVGDLLQGRLGRSIQSGNEVMDDLSRYVPASLQLVLLAMGFACAVGVPLGILSAVRRHSLLDHGIRVLAVSGVALPAFWIALLLQLVLAVWMGWLPTGGQLSIAADPPPVITGMVLFDALLAGQWAIVGDAAAHSVLPAFVLSLPCLASVLRVNRAEMIEVLGSDHITAARAHGVVPRRVVGRLALKNAMLPTLAMIGLRFGWMLGSTVLVETVFDWPGIGLYAVNSAIASDFKPVMGVTLTIGLIFMLANLLVDLAYGWLDPRTRSA
ncbi:ABC transporter permease [Roseomonas nepalensis]|uniref:ABC transporter permease n=1 Tax=Muricoccus nepalensis TaxID=1854500 RepID=A0A502F4F7_9PROT|nr:ABC transporter permease [Roseomonas nepalensis]TPG44282.1 ABC transporter permease [Roseomonas nepalensis]